MATARRILIKGIGKTLMVELIQANYQTDRTAIYDHEFREVFLDKGHYAFIVSDAYVDGWTELDVDFNTSAEEHDDFLLKISKDYQTTVLFGYSQTTSGDTRFLAVENGVILRSVYQKSYDEPSRILMETDLGEKSTFEKDFDYPKPGENIEGYHFLDFYDEIQPMFEDYGYKGNPRAKEEEKYLHVEYLNK